MKSSNALACVLLVSALAPTLGCELIASPDRSRIEPDGPGPSTSASGGGGAGASDGGGGASDGGGGQGGAGGTGSCVTDDDCSVPDGAECLEPKCEAGACTTVPKPAGTPAGTQTDGDCKVSQCDGRGAIESVADDADLPDDGNECTDDVCNSGVPSNPVVRAGVACTRGGGSLCDGAGSCVECLSPSDCPGQDTDCQARTCDAGVCGVVNAPQGSPVASQTAGDCRKNQCDDSGGVESVPDDGDVQDDGNECTIDSCDGGVPVTTNAPIDSPCGAGGALKCNGMGACVGCNDVSQCAPPSNECLVATCIGGSCGTAPVADGTACNDGDACTQTDTCQAGACSGGNPVTCSPLDACHVAGTCNPATGVCSNPNAPDGTPCPGGTCVGGACVDPCADGQQNGNETDIDCGGGTCPACANGEACGVDGDCSSGHCLGGVCVECVTAADCPGIDDDCKTRTCDAVAHTCGLSFAPSGTPTPSQTPGDCKQSQCDGAGNAVMVNDDADLPIDGNECTSDVCSGGMPSNPPLQAGTPCSQSGGDTCDGAGACVVQPDVVAVSPADGAANTSTGVSVSVTFNTAMNAATLVAQTAEGPCTGTIQVSSNDFTQCIAFTTAAPAMTGGNTIATLVPLGGLYAGTTYRIRITTGAEGAIGLPLASDVVQPTGFSTVAGASACDEKVVISQVYGGGGNSGAAYTNDFVVLHNEGTTPVSLAGMSLQYASANGTQWTGTLALTGTIAPGGHFLVQLASGGSNGAAMPTPDQTGSFNMAAGAGKVALVRGTTPLPSGCPDASRRIDLVGYGSGAEMCFEGTAAAPGLNATLAAIRNEAGCADTNANNSNFTAGAPAPLNSASPAASCTCNAVANELGTVAEADFCVLQFPPSISIPSGTTTGLVYGRVYEAQTTEPGGAAPNVIAQVGWGPAGSDPTASTAWRWYTAPFNLQVGNDDEYFLSFTAPSAGTYPYTYRFSFDGLQWTYCDTDGAGANAGLAFSPASLGVMTVVP